MLCPAKKLAARARRLLVRQSWHRVLPHRAGHSRKMPIRLALNRRVAVMICSEGRLATLRPTRLVPPLLTRMPTRLAMLRRKAPTTIRSVMIPLGTMTHLGRKVGSRAHDDANYSPQFRLRPGG